MCQVKSNANSNLETSLFGVSMFEAPPTSRKKLQTKRGNMMTRFVAFVLAGGHCILLGLEREVGDDQGFADGEKNDSVCLW